jgi:hypothetical protein
MGKAMSEMKGSNFNPNSIDPLEGKEYPTMHRIDVRLHEARELKMCEKCDGSFLRAVGSMVKYCRKCQSAIAESVQ